MGNYTVNLDGVEKVFNAGSAGYSQVLHANVSAEPNFSPQCLTSNFPDLARQ